MICFLAYFVQTLDVIIVMMAINWNNWAALLTRLLFPPDVVPGSNGGAERRQLKSANLSAIIIRILSYNLLSKLTALAEKTA